MIMLPVQLLGFMGGVFMLYITHLYVKRKEMKLYESWIWYVIWVVLIFISVFPKFIDYVEPIVDVQRILDLIFILCIMVLFGIMFFLYCTASRTEKRLDKLIEQLK